MARLLVDEDLPRSLTRSLLAAGFDVMDVRDIGLRGAPDEAIFRHASADERVIVTRDRGFASLIRFPASRHPGIILLRIPNTVAIAQLSRVAIDALKMLDEATLRHHVIVVELNRVRVRPLR